MQTVQDMLALDRHGDLSFVGALLCLVIILLQPDAVSYSLHRFSDKIQLISGLLNAASQSWDWLQAMFE